MRTGTKEFSLIQIRGFIQRIFFIFHDTLPPPLIPKRIRVQIMLSPVIFQYRVAIPIKETTVNASDIIQPRFPRKNFHIIPCILQRIAIPGRRPVSPSPNINETLFGLVIQNIVIRHRLGIISDLIPDIKKIVSSLIMIRRILEDRTLNHGTIVKQQIINNSRPVPITHLP